MRIERGFRARSLAFGFGILLALAAAAPGRLMAADPTYNYTGNPFTAGAFTGDDLTASFTLNSALPDNQASANDLSLVVSWTISDGAGHTISSSTSPDTLITFDITTNNVGTITEWNFEGCDTLNCNDFIEQYYSNNPERYNQIDGANRSGVGDGSNDTAGKFGPSTAVPEEPSILDLMCSGLILLTALIAVAIKARNRPARLGPLTGRSGRLAVRSV